MTEGMRKRERLEKAFDLECPERPPVLGGWLAAPGHIQTLTGCGEEAYWADPIRWGIEAERVLDSDGIINIVVPEDRHDYRIVDHGTLKHRSAYTEEKVLSEIESNPTPDEQVSQFDEDLAYEALREELNSKQNLCGDMVWMGMPEVCPTVLWSNTFGYETAMTTMALHPEAWKKLLRFSAEKARQTAVLHARAVREGLLPRAVFTGEDLCSQQGPMVSPEFLRKECWPLLEYSLEPLLQEGVKVVWHCDGNYRPLIDDLLACGIAGLQGFQDECGMTLDWIINLRTRSGDPLLIFGPMSVTTLLPHGTQDAVRAEVQRAMNMCRDKASLVFFTSNTVNPDVPLENIRAYRDAVRESTW